MEKTGCFSEIVEERLKSIDQLIGPAKPYKVSRRSNRIMEE